MSNWGNLPAEQDKEFNEWYDKYSAFFRIQLSHPYMTTVKTIALTR